MTYKSKIIPQVEKNVPPAQTEVLFQALKNHGVEAERYFGPNASHSDDYWQQDEVFALITEFLTAHL